MIVEFKIQNLSVWSAMVDMNYQRFTGENNATLIFFNLLMTRNWAQNNYKIQNLMEINEVH